MGEQVGHTQDLLSLLHLPDDVLVRVLLLVPRGERQAWHPRHLSRVACSCRCVQAPCLLLGLFSNLDSQLISSTCGWLVHQLDRTPSRIRLSVIECTALSSFIFRCPTLGRPDLNLELLSHVRRKLRDLVASDCQGILFWQVPSLGPSHGDTFLFDTWTSTYDQVAQVGSTLRVAAVKVWSSRFVNGLQLTGTCTAPDGTCSPVESEEHWGNHHWPVARTLVLESHEEIVSVVVRFGMVMDSIVLHLSSGRAERFGTSEGGCIPACTLRAPEGCRVVGFIGGFGGHLHSLGLIVAAPASWRPERQQGLQQLVGRDVD